MPEILAGWCNRQELLRLIRKQAKGDELTTTSAKSINTCERATSICALRTAVFKEASGRIFIRQNDRFFGRFQDGFRNGKKNIVSYYGNCYGFI